MHITLEADYSIRMMVYMARVGKRVDAKTISENAEVTLRFALKILRKFAANGIVKSFKGMQGGYELARPAKEITLKEIVETVEGTYYFSRCLNPENGCSRVNPETCYGPCKAQEIFREISELVQNRLEQVTLDMLV